MISALVRLALLGGVLAAVIDRLLARQRGGADPEPLRMLVVVDAPIERTWEVVADVVRQPEWMTEMTSLTLLDPLPLRPGSRAEATVRILGISVTDPVTVTEITPPSRYAIRHEGLFRGSGVITLEGGATGETTIVRWEETLIPPVLPELGMRVQAPILRAIFQEDLERLKRMVEHGSAG